MLTLQLELMESRWARFKNGEAGPTQLDDYQRCSNTLRRLLETVGLQRRPKEVPDLSTCTCGRSDVV